MDFPSRTAASSSTNCLSTGGGRKKFVFTCQKHGLYIKKLAQADELPLNPEKGSTSRKPQQSGEFIALSGQG